MIDDEHSDRAARRLELQAQLLLQHRVERTGIAWRLFVGPQLQHARKAFRIELRIRIESA